MRQLPPLLAGLIFGLGLCLSGMADPAKVLNFLDVAGTWDPSLAFVMAGAIVVALPGFRLLHRRQAPLFAERFHWPKRSPIDARLVAGAAVFGMGWGLSGFCPGPAILSVPPAAPGALVFVAAMLVGFALARVVLSSRSAPGGSQEPAE